jgi:glycosyltransferase involved in cell wall biosynthesis
MKLNNIKRLSIIIPCYNEEATITHILDKVIEAVLPDGINKEIIIVNDCSSDDTSAIVLDYIEHKPVDYIYYLSHPVNQGKGAAIHTGISHATGDFVVVQDADLEYDPREYNKLLQPIIDGHADIVFGSRFMGGSAHRILFFWHSIGNRALTFLSNVCNNLNLTDMETGYKVFRTSIIQSIRLQEKRFGFEPEVTAKIARLPNVRLYEVGISYYGRTYKDGKKIKWRDGMRAVLCILKYAFYEGNEIQTFPQRQMALPIKSRAIDSPIIH